MIETRPVSPYLLLQEIYHPDQWKVLICCMLLNCTRRVQVDQIRATFFEQWPTPESVKDSDFEEMRELLKPLGFYNKRSKSIIRFSKEFAAGEWNDVSELYGIGQYARDSYSIFFEDKIVENPSDHVLKDYVKWYSNFKIASNEKSIR